MCIRWSWQCIEASLAQRVLNRYTDLPPPQTTLARSPRVLFVGTELDALEEASVRMVAPQAVDELDVESHGEVSHSDEDVPEVFLFCWDRIPAWTFEISFQLEIKDGAEICSFSTNQLINSGL